MENHVIRLNKIIAEKFGVPEDEITPKSDLASDLNLSNLEITDLISEVSREFELHFREGTDIGKIQKVEDLIYLIEAYSEDIL